MEPGDTAQLPDTALCFQRIDKTTRRHIGNITAREDIGLKVATALNELCNTGPLQDGTYCGNPLTVATT